MVSMSVMSWYFSAVLNFSQFPVFPSVLSHRVAELGAVVGRAGLRIEAVEINNKQLGMETH